MSKEEIIQKLVMIKSAIGPLNKSEQFKSIFQYVSIELDNIKNGIVTSRFTNGIDLTGQSFGMIKVIGVSNKTKWSCNSGWTYNWKCLCSCGNTIELRTEQILHHKGRFPLMCSKCRGQLTAKHNGTKSSLYAIWTRIKQSCYDINYPSYKYNGAKGVKVFDEWVNNYDSFMEWAITNGYRSGMSIQRNNKNDDWSPNNCFFVQNRHKQITLDGETHTIAEWCRIKGVDRSKVEYRKSHGVPENLWFYKGSLKNLK